MNWEKIDERYRYTMTVVWMNSIGLIVDILRIVKTNKKITNLYLREENIETLKVTIAKLLLVIGAVCLALYFLWSSSKILLILSLSLILLGICGRIMSGLKTFIDEFMG